MADLHFQSGEQMKIRIVVSIQVSGVIFFFDFESGVQVNDGVKRARIFLIQAESLIVPVSCWCFHWSRLIIQVPAEILTCNDICMFSLMAM